MIAKDFPEIEYVSLPGKMLKLHEAMAKVLANCPAKTARFDYLAALIAEHKLYIRKDGAFASPSQLRWRARNKTYVHMFEVLSGNRVRLR